MRKYIFLVVGMLMMISAVYSQRVAITEDFDGSTVSFSSIPPNMWNRNSIYFTTSPYSYWGFVPNSLGDSTVLVTPFYDFHIEDYTGIIYAQLRFKHICKIAPSDIGRIEYRENQVGATWKELPFAAYQGTSAMYGITKGFNSDSYNQWEANDLLRHPALGWWKEEVFDIGTDVAYGEFQFRFVLKHGDVQGTQAAYGWLIDDINVIIEGRPILTPTIEFIAPLVQDTLHIKQPYEIRANLKSNSGAPFRRSPLLYTVTTYNGVSVLDSIPMSIVGGAQWRATIPEKELYTEVRYYISEEDTSGYRTTAQSGYILTQDPKKGLGNNSVELYSFDTRQTDITTGIANPVKISIENTGLLSLTSVSVGWSLNGTVQNPFAWTGNLSWGDIDPTVVIGSYTPTPNQFDTIVVWLSNPNGVPDPITHNDTVTVQLYGCHETLAGNYTIGAGEDFSSIGEMVEVLTFCGLSGNITAQLKNGTIMQSVDLSGIDAILGNYTLRITSLSGKRDSVIIRPPTLSSGIIIGNSGNIIIDDITVDASVGNGLHAIEFTANVHHITIENCVLKANYAGNGYANGCVIYRNSAVVVSNLFIRHNMIDGGFAGVYFNGSGTYAPNIFIDSNTIDNSYNYGIYLYSCDSSSVSGNLIRSRESNNVGNNWRGMQINYLNGCIERNKIRQRNATIAGAYGIYIGYMNTNDGGVGSIANNDIVLTCNSNGATFGIYVFNSVCAILHNSITIGGTAGTAYGLYAPSNNTVKNNNIFASPNNSIPFYIVGNITAATLLDVDYNNYYAPVNVGVANYAEVKSLTAWQAIVTSDLHSVQVHPDFIDSVSSSELATYTSLACPVLSSIRTGTDIDNAPRVANGLTTMGCYAYPVFGIDASLIGIWQWGTSPLQGAKDNVKIIVSNGGVTPLTAASIDWEFNGIGGTSVSLSKTLAYGESDTILLGEITYQSGENILKTWISDLGGLTDAYSPNDTIVATHFGCDSSFHGVYTVGTTGTFTTVEEALSRIYSCGIDGAITLALQDGVYPPINLRGAIPGSNMTNVLTITSFSGDKEKAIIQPSARAGITIGEIENICISNITIDARINAGTYGINFVSACNNIEIRNNIILANLTGTGPDNAYAPIYKATATGISHNIRIVNNEIDGGYTGIHFYAGRELNYGTGIVIDSNIATNQHANAMVLYYIDFASFSHNTVSSRDNPTVGAWNGFQIYYVNGDIIANRILQRSAVITNSTGIYLSDYNYTGTTTPGTIANNEIIFLANAGMGMNVQTNVNANIFHNSVYTGGSGIGLYFYNDNVNTTLSIRNNNLIATGIDGGPVHFWVTNHLTTSWFLDANNYYSPYGIIALTGQRRVVVDSMAAWQIIGGDMNASLSMPDFIDINNSLKFRGNNGLICPLLPEIVDDIEGKTRVAPNTVGAYYFEQVNLDVAPQAIVTPTEYSVSGTQENVSVILYNGGLTAVTSMDIYWKLDNVLQPVYHWTGTLRPLQLSAIVTIGSFIPIDGENKLQIWTTNPNGITDELVENDTIRGYTLACNGGLSGVYSVGNGGNISSLSNAMKLLDNCGLSGNLTLAMTPGFYGDLTLGNIQGTSQASRLTFTSFNGIANEVNFGNIEINALSYITVEKVKSTGVNLGGNASFIDILKCHIVTTGNGINKSTNAIVTDSVHLIGNTIEGGNIGIYFNTANPSTVWIDSNNLLGQSQYGMQLLGGYFVSVSHNTIKPNPQGTGNWRGMQLSSVYIGMINGNRIHSFNLVHTIGMYLTGVNVNKEPVLICNNEIITMQGSNDWAVIRIAQANAKIMYNTIFAGGDANSAVSYPNDANSIFILKYNNLIATKNGYPVYLYGYHPSMEISNNNYYAPVNVGYAGGSVRTTLSAWQSVVTQDNASTQIQLQYIDSLLSLELTDYNGLEVSADNEVPYDILGNPRIGITSKGCYGAAPSSTDALLSKVVNWSESVTIGQQDSIKVVLTNGGYTPLTNVNIAWQFNNQTQTTKLWNGALNYGQSVVVTLGAGTYQPQTNSLKAWISDLGGLMDSYPDNDSISAITYGCDSAFNGTYTIGVGGDFTTINDAVRLLYICGINGAVRIELLDNLYPEVVELNGKIPGADSANVITFTSAAGRSTPARVQRTNGYNNEAPFILNATSDIILSNLHLDGQAPSDVPTFSKAVILNNACQNIEINNCYLSIPFIETYNHMVIEQQSSGLLHDIRILNNTIEGGLFGINLSGPEETNPNTNILIKNNTIRNIGAYGMNLLYSELNIINNTITQGSGMAEFYGISLNRSSGEIVGNKIQSDRFYYGIYATAIRHITNRPLIANNEIKGNAISNDKSGIHISNYADANVYHNSVSLGGTVPVRALTIYYNYTGVIDVQNNNFVTASNHIESYPVHIGAQSVLANCTFDNNNYYNYAGNNVGYYGEDKTLSGWQMVIFGDVHSTNIQPLFSNRNLSLEIADGLTRPRLPLVANDIDSIIRTTTTTVGAYHFVPYPTNIAPVEIVSPLATVSTVNTENVRVIIQNFGLDTVTSATIHWSVNGVDSTPYNWIGNLAPKSLSDTIFIGSFLPINGSNHLRIWTVSPNGTTDNNLLNDTLNKEVYGCEYIPNGLYAVGASKQFTSITDAVKNMQICGIDTAVTVAIEPGTYAEIIEITQPIPKSSSVNTVTFTSASGNAATTIIQRPASLTTDVAPFVLEEASNIILSKLTLNGSAYNATSADAYSKALILKGACQNIEINSCILKVAIFPEVTPTSENYTVIHNPSGDKMSNIRILNNTLEGGAFSIRLYGLSTLNLHENILIQNNNIQSVGLYGIYLQNIEGTVSNNTIVQKASYPKNAMYGIYTWYSSLNTIGNHIKADSASSGINLGSPHYSKETNDLLSNNEIIIKKLSNTSASGISVSGTINVDVLHNSVLVGGTQGRGALFVDPVGNRRIMIKNNNLIAATTDAIYPIHFYSASGNILSWDVNYNNYYSPVVFAYAGGAITSLSAWRAIVPSDTNSVTVVPQFLGDSMSSLELSDYSGLSCSIIPMSIQDIRGKYRVGSLTYMGAYELPLVSRDVLLNVIDNIPDFVANGEQIIPKIVFKNAGTSPVNSVTLNWTFNGSPQQAQTWNGLVDFLEEDTITLNPVFAALGQNIMTVWITDVNTTGADMEPLNDTLKMSFFSCDSLMHGDYIVGVGGDFADITNALDRMSVCGVNGDMRLLVKGGTYAPIDLTNLDNLIRDYHLTITAMAGDSVSIKSSSTAPCITLKNTHNLTLENLTIDATTTMKGIYFSNTPVGNCKNIYINNCNIFGDTITTNTAYILVHFENNPGTVDNISITNCVLRGGYYGIYLYGQPSNYYTDITIDSNDIYGQYYYGIYFYYMNLNSCSYNRIRPRSIAQYTQWQGIYFYNAASGGELIGNRIFASNINITSTLYGISCSFVSNATIANNEIYLYGNANNTRGITVDYAKKLNILNNSVYVYKTTNTGNVYAHYNYINGDGYSAVVRNNIFVAEGGLNTYAFYFAGTAANFNSYSTNYDVDYNLMYSTWNIGYATAMACQTLADWQVYMPRDKRSLNIRPAFIDSSLNLKLGNYDNLSCFRHNNAPLDIENDARSIITTIGAYSLPFPDVYDLTLKAMTEPSMSSTLCTYDYVSVKYNIFNSGAYLYDFSTDSMTIHFHMTGMLSFDTTLTINSGTLEATQSTVVDIMDFLPVYYAGNYDITAWIESGIDTIHSNDTLRTTYQNMKIALPYDQQFDSVNIQGLVISSLNLSNNWKVVPAGYDTIIEPIFGTGKLIFDAPISSMSRLRTGQLELNRTSQPKLEFWYAHDNQNPTQRDQIDVKITCNGRFYEMSDYQILSTIQRYDPSYTTPTWVKYTIDLTPYVDSACVIVFFDAISFGGVQQIDRIAITSNQDLEMTDILLPNIDVCDRKGKELKVILSNITGQNVDFSVTPAEVHLRIRGTKTDDIVYPLTGTMDGLQVDTLTLHSNYDFIAGNYQFSAYINTAVADFNRGNDTANSNISINPALSVQIQPESMSNCLTGELGVNPTITLYNSGNMDLSNINMIIQVDTGENNVAVYTLFQETYTGMILAGNNATHMFTNSYTVPWNARYNVRAIVYLSCDSVFVNSTTMITECVDMKDLYIVSIDNPSGTTDAIGATVNVTATLHNRADNELFNASNLTVLVEDSKGVQTASFTETLPSIGTLATVSHTFNQSYTVPNDTVYYLTVYTNSNDNYRHNDTLKIKRETVTVGVETLRGIDGFTLSQNIPNPANNRTRIDYSIPEAGEVVFHVHSVSGQLLYSKTTEATSGKQSLELNTSSFAAGIYFYSIEYKGQRLVRRMMISD